MSGVSAEPTVYRVGIARGATTTEAWVFDLPGCCAVAPSREAVLHVLPVVIAEHLSWLDDHGEVTRNAFPFQYEVVEEIDSRELRGIADGEFAFDDDLKPALSDDVDAAIRRLGFARKELLRVVSQLPDAVLDWSPPETAVSADAWVPEVRTIREIVQHIASADGYYIRSISASAGAQTEAERFDLFAQRQRVIERLRTLTTADFGREFRTRQRWQRDGQEHWTVRKALRRLISHERFHTKEIEQRLAWLLVGVPAVATASAAKAASHA